MTGKEEVKKRATFLGKDVPRRWGCLVRLSVRDQKAAVM